VRQSKAAVAVGLERTAAVVDEYVTVSLPVALGYRTPRPPVRNVHGEGSGDVWSVEDRGSTDAFVARSPTATILDLAPGLKEGC
jgi:hypothetical protein